MEYDGVLNNSKSDRIANCVLARGCSTLQKFSKGHALGLPPELPFVPDLDPSKV